MLRCLALTTISLATTCCGVWELPAQVVAPSSRRDDTALAASGIRKVSGQHLDLYTDLPPQPGVDELPAVFDQAIPLWASYFDVELWRLANWRVTAYLIEDKQRFSRYGLIPDDLPEFLHGFQRGDELWFYEQPSDYYRRHLLLHEGTHAFMREWLGGAGPPWYMEGIAEIVATHRWSRQKLELGYFPADKREVAHWGRIKLVKDELAAGRAPNLTEIMQYRPQEFFQVKAYSWCWAACSFFERHPLTSKEFQRLQKNVTLPGHEFSRRFVASLAKDKSKVRVAWQLFLHHLDYGYDVAADRIEYRDLQPLPTGLVTVRINAARGWQSTGYRLRAGKSYRLTARGRYQVGQAPKPWWCEPQGVTIEYHQGEPLGKLLAAVDDESHPQPVSPLVQPVAVGRDHVLRCEHDGTLFLRINEAAGNLGDNRGWMSVKIELAKAQSSSGGPIDE